MFYKLQKEKEKLCIEIMDIIQKSDNNSITLSDIKTKYKQPIYNTETNNAL